jgi:hypothetical protein
LILEGEIVANFHHLHSSSIHPHASPLVTANFRQYPLIIARLHLF